MSVADFQGMNGPVLLSPASQSLDDLIITSEKLISEEFSTVKIKKIEIYY